MIDEDHKLESRDYHKYFMNIANKYNISGDDLKTYWIDESDEQKLHEDGSFPANINKFNGKYK